MRQCYEIAPGLRVFMCHGAPPPSPEVVAMLLESIAEIEQQRAQGDAADGTAPAPGAPARADG